MSDSYESLLNINAELFNETKADKEKRLSLTKATERLEHIRKHWFNFTRFSVGNMDEATAQYQMARLLHRNSKKLKSIAMALDSEEKGIVMEAVKALSEQSEGLEGTSLKAEKDETSNVTLDDLEVTPVTPEPEVTPVTDENEEITTTKKEEENEIMENTTIENQEDIKTNTPSTKELLAAQLAGATNAGGGVDGNKPLDLNNGHVPTDGDLPDLEADTSGIRESVGEILAAQSQAAEAFSKGNTINGLIVKKQPVSARLTTKAEENMISIPYDKLAELRATVIDKTGAEFETDAETGNQVLVRATNSPASEFNNVKNMIAVLDDALLNVDQPLITKMYVADPTFPIVGFELSETASTAKKLYTKDEMQATLINQTSGFLENPAGDVQVHIKVLSGKTAKKKRKKLDDDVAKGASVSATDALKAVTSVGVSATDKKDKEGLMIFLSDVSATEFEENATGMKSALYVKYYGDKGRTNSKGQKIPTTMRLTGTAVAPLKKMLPQDEAYSEKFPVSAGLNAIKSPEENKKALEAALTAVTAIASNYGVAMAEDSLVSKIVNNETTKEAKAAAEMANDI